ncbi:6777_t:CDS:2 [Cetraspora pellucida]|uniref:6777_t:CDS:1 n=1 Tax=Cetraspora pellucida TaxID=1433469 RepID=A0A9N9NX25_9GLOM|nr:6777_t:CDS:2 [Cetraspora pellucida]
MSTLSSRNNQQEIYEDLPPSYNESQASEKMSDNNMTKPQLVAKVNDLMAALDKQKEDHANEISLYQTTLKKQKQEMKETHANEISLYRELINAKTNEITTLMSTIENYKKEVERIEEIRKKHEYEYNERLKEKEKTHKREREERERNYKRETDLMQETINSLEQTIRDLQTQLRNYENVSTPELY